MRRRLERVLVSGERPLGTVAAMSYEPPGGPPPPPSPAWQPQQAGAPYPASAYSTPGYSYAPAGQPKSLKGLSTATMILLAVAGLAAIYGAIALFHRASVVDDFTSFGGASIQDVKDADDGAAASFGLFVVALIAAGVVWIIWQFRHAKNAELLRGNYGLPSGWAIGGWFIPLGNYVLPQLQLFQAAKASDPDLPPGQPASAGRSPSSIVSWWIVTDLAWLLFGVGRTIRPSNDELNFGNLDRFVRADRLGGFSFLLFIAGAVLAIHVVKSLTERQTLALSRYTPSVPPPAYQPAPPPPYQQQWQQPAAPPPPYAAPPPYSGPPPAAPPPFAPPPPAPAPPPAPPQQWPPPPPP
jgi:hypothetical protein